MHWRLVIPLVSARSNPLMGARVSTKFIGGDLEIRVVRFLKIAFQVRHNPPCTILNGFLLAVTSFLVVVMLTS